MQWTFLRRLLGRKDTSASVDQTTSLATTASLPARTQTPFYPAADPGFPVVSVDDLLASHKRLIKRLKECASTSDDEWERKFEVPIKRLAQWVHLLPATASGVYAEPGGILRQGIETAFFSYQASAGRIFTGEMSVEMRHMAEPRWRYGCFLAGLVASIQRPLGESIITVGTSAQWSVFKGPLTDWLGAQERYYVNWTAAAVNGGTAEATTVLRALLDDEEWIWLEEAGREVVRAIYRCCDPAMRASEGLVQDVVSIARAKLVQREDALRNNRYGHVKVGAHLEPQLLDAMRQLIDSGRWQINDETGEGVLWYGSDGLYMRWPMAAADITRQLDDSGVVGAPRASLSILEVLVSARIVECSEGNNPVWTLSLPVRDTDDRKFVAALKFEEPKAVLDVDAYQPLTERVAINSGPAKPVVPPPADTPKPQAPSAAKNTDAGSSENTTTPVAEDASPRRRPQRAEALVATRDLFVDAQKGAARHLDEAVRARLSEPLAEVLGLWVNAFNAGEEADSMMRVDGGVAIAYAWADSAGLNADQIISDLDKAGLLHKPNGAVKVVRLKFSGAKEQKAFILKRASAIEMGFALPEE